MDLFFDEHAIEDLALSGLQNRGPRATWWNAIRVKGRIRVRVRVRVRASWWNAIRVKVRIRVRVRVRVRASWWMLHRDIINIDQLIVLLSRHGAPKTPPSEMVFCMSPTFDHPWLPITPIRVRVREFRFRRAGGSF